MLGTGEPPLRPLPPVLLGATADIVGQVRAGRLRADVTALPGPRGRLHAPEQMARADALILGALRDAGWQAQRWPFHLRYALGIRDYGSCRPAVYPRLAGANIIAVKRGERADEAVLVGAHHDTVPGSPGADDNGAGVAALLELARVLAPYRFRRSILLAAFDMEEIGLLGAKALLPSLRREYRIVGAVIFETMAYTARTPHSQSVPPGLDVLYRGQMARLTRRELAGDFTAIIYNGPALTLARWMGEGIAHLAGPDAPLLLRDPNDLPLVGPLLRRCVPAVRNFSRSDHVVFWRAGIPAVQITDTADFRNPHYHRSTDTPETLDYDRLAAIVGATAVTLARTAKLSGTMNDEG